MTDKPISFSDFVLSMERRKRITSDLNNLILNWGGTETLAGIRDNFWKSGALSDFFGAYRFPTGDLYVAGGLILTAQWPEYVNGYKRYVPKEGQFDFSDDEDVSSQVKKHAEKLFVLACLPRDNPVGFPRAVVFPNIEIRYDFKETLHPVEGDNDARLFIQQEIERYRQWRLGKNNPPPFDIKDLERRVIKELSESEVEILPREYDYLWEATGLPRNL